jgi:hypothetical protein
MTAASTAGPSAPGEPVTTEESDTAQLAEKVFGAVRFSCEQASSEEHVMNYLFSFHKIALENSPSYQAMIDRTVSLGKISIVISDEFDRSGSTDWDHQNGEHMITINPYVDGDAEIHDDIMGNAVVSLVFELANASTMQELSEIGQIAANGLLSGKELSSGVDKVSAVDRQLARNESDGPAVHYAREVERLEYQSNCLVHTVDQELRASGQPGVEREWPDYHDFSDYYETQVSNNHTQPYLEDYDELVHRFRETD